MAQLLLEYKIDKCVQDEKYSKALLFYLKSNMFVKVHYFVTIFLQRNHPAEASGKGSRYSTIMYTQYSYIAIDVMYCFTQYVTRSAKPCSHFGFREILNNIEYTVLLLQFPSFLQVAKRIPL